MPATVTHHLFTNDVYKNLKIEIKNSINEDLFNIFGKSFDILFFTNSKIGFVAHNNKVKEYFYNLIKYIKDNDLTNNPEILAFLYGTVCHYVLDSTIHPYVYYKSGRYYYDDKPTLKYRGKHAYVETMMDAAIYEQQKKTPIWKACLAKEVFSSNLKFSLELENMINDVFVKTYNVNNVSYLFKNGYRNYRFLFKYGMVSRWGIKAFIYKILDVFKVYKKGRLRNLCYYIKSVDNNVLNLDRNLWCYPADKNLSFHYSFFDLYDIAIEKAKNMITFISDNLDNADVNILLDKIGNNSYYTGLDVDEKYKMKYFEY